MAKQRYHVRPVIRNCVEHIFSDVTMPIGGKMTKKIAIEKNKVWQSLKNLAFNVLQYLQGANHAFALI